MPLSDETKVALKPVLAITNALVGLALKEAIPNEAIRDGLTGTVEKLVSERGLEWLEQLGLTDEVAGKYISGGAHVVFGDEDE